MMLLTLAENAIKHGLSPLPEGGFIRVSARVNAGRLQLEVADSGQGFIKTSGGGTGLANVRARLAAIYGQAAQLSIAMNRPRGVTALIALPYSSGSPGAAPA
jgi:LytS/YehU family sensor histidine kinase